MILCFYFSLSHLPLSIQDVLSGPSSFSPWALHFSHPRSPKEPIHPFDSPLPPSFNGFPLSPLSPSFPMRHTGFLEPWDDNP
jgi:hypothetical protein